MLPLAWDADTLFEKIRNREMNLKNALCTMPPYLGWDFMQDLSSFLIFFFSSDPHDDALIIGLYYYY